MWNKALLQCQLLSRSTTPPVDILAVPVPFIIDQVPPGVASVNAGVFEFSQTDIAPPVTGEMAGNASIVRGALTELVHVPLK